MRRIAIAAAPVLGIFFALAPARASEMMTPSGVSVGAGFDYFSDDTLTDSSGESVHPRTGELGLSVLGNVGGFAAGGVVAVSPGIFGDGRLLLGVRAGFQPTIGRTRLQLLGEVGVHQYTQVDEGLFSTSTPDFFSTTYVGAQVGITRSLVKDGVFEYGVALFFRMDQGQQKILHTEGNFLTGETTPPTTLNVGGTMAGVSLTVGLRLDRATVAATRSRPLIER